MLFEAIIFLARGRLEAPLLPRVLGAHTATLCRRQRRACCQGAEAPSFLTLSLSPGQPASIPSLLVLSLLAILF